MQKYYNLFFMLLPSVMISQIFQGKIYDEESTVSGVKILNVTQNILVYSNENGNFKIDAAIDDIISLQSFFHSEKRIVLLKKDFEETIVIDLKKAVNDLDEVLIKNEPDFKPFDPIEANTTLKNQIQEDIKRNPQLYSKLPNGAVDIFAVAGLIVNLFKSKKPKEEAIKAALFSDFKNLFETDSYFTMRFLKNELKVPEDYVYLFMDYCEAQYINLKLLEVENRFMLLDAFLKHSDEFLEILKAHEKD